MRRFLNGEKLVGLTVLLGMGLWLVEPLRYMPWPIAIGVVGLLVVLGGSALYAALGGRRD